MNANPAIAPVRLTPKAGSIRPPGPPPNGVPAEQFIDLGVVPNHLMPRVLREMDVAVFPNRCEGGTNLVAMECMACGVPAIVASNTGQRDLIATGAAFRCGGKARCRTATAAPKAGAKATSRKSSPGSEHFHANRDKARPRRGRRGGDADWSWRNQIVRLHDALAPLGAGAAA